MELLNFAQLLVVFVSLTFAVIHFQLREKHLFHIVFAIFCASTAMYVAYKLTGNYWSPYHHLIGMFGIFTSSGYWLFARAFFRKSNPINHHHLLFVGLLSSCLILWHLIQFLGKIWLTNSEWISALATVLTELIDILYPGMLILIFWEGYRVLNNTTATQRKIATIYLSSFVFCVFSVMLIGATLPSGFMDGAVQDWLSAFAFLVILTSTHSLIRFRQHLLEQKSNSTPSDDEEKLLAARIQVLLVEEKLFLESNLRVADIARELDVPEYRIRAVMLNQFNAKNFNHYVNQMRIEHAKTILKAPDKQDWPVLVVGIESGFASAAPFTRAFKEFTGCTPGQYRKQQSSN
ncbi:helix-turn-helix domain-containing protein [Shewanella aestuarii]|uniref:Helix-turn-helix transcriptional regulator n=1 Tax=Shewanella aestuarii TaxID=1028752 RepID=A0A6G9QKU2_9GAMM|nr:helix-turn-helix transcriptional regulator [Shewanella aestuarii]QIR14677.1 helix-turn-helix transcriptional regulator [Shewanella aestuarii]